MALTRLSVGKAIELAFDDRKVETISEAKVILMREGTKDLEDELKARQTLPADVTVDLFRTPLGDVGVTVTKVAPTRG